MKLSSLQTFKRSSFLLAVALALGTMAHADTVRVDNDWLAVGGKNRAIAVGEDVSGALDGFFQVSSGSAPTLKVSGLPSGVKFDAKTQTFSGVPVKAGVYYVTCSAKNKNGYSHSFVGVWTVGGASNGDYDDIWLDGWFDLNELEQLATGDSIMLCTNLKSVSGLPTGLKLFDTSCGDNVSYLFGEHCHAVFTPIVKMKVCAHSVSNGKCFTTNELVPIHWRPLDE